MNQKDLVRFGSIVRARREELGIQQDDMRDHQGPSSTTMSGIERGVIDPARSTLRKLDVGLRWVQGSAAKTLDGGTPEALPVGADVEPVDERGFIGEDPREDAPDLIGFANRIAEAAEKMFTVTSDVGLVTVLQPAVRMLSMASQSIGLRLRQEEGVMESPEQGVAEWFAVYAEQLQELAATAVRVSSILNRAMNGSSDDSEWGPAVDAAAAAVIAELEVDGIDDKRQQGGRP